MGVIFKLNNYSVLFSLLHTNFCFPPCFILSFVILSSVLSFRFPSRSILSCVLRPAPYSVFVLLPDEFSVVFSSMLCAQFFSAQCFIFSVILLPAPFSAFSSCSGLYLFFSFLHTQFCCSPRSVLSFLPLAPYFICSSPCSTLSFVLPLYLYSVLFSLLHTQFFVQIASP